MNSKPFGKDAIAFDSAETVLHHDSLLRNGLVLTFLFRGEFLIFWFFYRDFQFPAFVILLKTLVSQVQADFKRLKPWLGRVKFHFENCVIMSGAYVNLAQKPDFPVRGADYQGLYRVAFFLPL